ncbi:MAG TPA: hypothetical protein VJJ28_01705 [Candidatus Paceibacterota bacterium]
MNDTTTADIPGLCKLNTYADFVAWTKTTCFDNPIWHGEDRYCLIYPILDDREMGMAINWCLSNGTSFYHQILPDGSLMVGIVEKASFSTNKRKRRRYNVYAYY